MRVMVIVKATNAFARIGKLADPRELLERWERSTSS